MLTLLWILCKIMAGPLIVGLIGVIAFGLNDPTNIEHIEREQWELEND